MSMRVHQELWDRIGTAGNLNSEPVYEVWKTNLATWKTRGDWYQYDGAAMNQCRDSMRQLLLEGGLDKRSLKITDKSNVDVIIEIFPV